VEIRPHGNIILLYLKVPMHQISLEKGFTRDLSKIGHFGTGDLEVKLQSNDDFEKAKPLILKSYEGN
jgi:predicted transport protein